MVNPDEYPQNMNCIFCNDSHKQKMCLLKPHPEDIQIIADNSKTNVKPKQLQKT